ncbi:MAG TPA: hypothetical protein VD858_15285 [Reyranella sp.]|nr:hypothetical protein [Reyranella sp.]
MTDTDASPRFPLLRYDDILRALDPKPFTAIGDTSSTQLYPFVGSALSKFEKIQDEIIRIFDQLCGGQFGAVSPMGQIIGATSSFNVKLDLAEQAAKSFIADSSQQQAVLRWLRLARKASIVRNKIAHGQPIYPHFVKDGRSLKGVFWAPSLLDTRKVGWPENGMSEWEFCWNGSQLSDYGTAFHSVYAMLLTLREELAGLGDETTASVLSPTDM